MIETHALESEVIRVALNIIKASASMVSTTELSQIMKITSEATSCLRRGLRRYEKKGLIKDVGRFKDGSNYWCWWDTDESESEKVSRAATLAARQVVLDETGRAIDMDQVAAAIKGSLAEERPKTTCDINAFLRSAPAGMRR